MTSRYKLAPHIIRRGTESMPEPDSSSQITPEQLRHLGAEGRVKAPTREPRLGHMRILR
jgi:hypothetical protein